ncbi:putative Fe-containing alcohol dehydrogenase [Seiridium cardinale]
MTQETLRPAFFGREKPLVSYGIGFTEALAQHVDDIFHSSSIYLLASKSLTSNTSHLQNAKSALGSKLRGIRVGMKPHSQWSEILQIVSDARACKADLLVTLGAGSLTDAAKVISLALANDVATAEEIESLHPESPKHSGHIEPAQIPIICIPTSLSGGEYSAIAGATNDETGRKWAFSAQAGIKCPDLVILDPELSTSTPEHIWLSTGVKSVDHCVETLCSLESDQQADEDARKGLQKLVPGLLGSKTDGRDLGKRLQCQLGVIDAMSACSRGVPLGASHGIGHQLGPVGVGHGETSCLLLPAVCKYNFENGANRERQNAVTEILWQLPEAAAIFEERNLKREKVDLGDLLDVVIQELGMPRSLSEFKIGEDQMDNIAEHSLQDRWVQSNPAPLDKKGVLDILKMIA